MKTSFLKGAITAAIIGCALPLFAQERIGAAKRLTDYDIPGLEQRVTITTLQSWDVVELIEFLAHRGGLNNIVIDQGVAGTKTRFKFEDVPVGDALEIVLAVNNLAYEVQDGIITILSDQKYQQLHGTSFYDNKRVEIINLAFADPSRVATMIEPIKSSIGTVVSDPATGTLILIDTPAKIAEMRTVANRADIPTIERIRPTVTRTFVLQYADVNDIQSDVSELLTKEEGELRVDERTKTLMVTDLPYNMQRIEDLIRVFDRRPKEVFIESKIVQVTLSDEYRLGINWNHLLESVDPRFTLTLSSEPGLIGTLGENRAPTASVGYKTIVGDGDLTVLMDALKSVGETKILSNPHVAVLDGQEATIKVITDQPYAEAQLESGTTNVVGETIRFIEVGVTLNVAPRINDTGLITMDIKPEVSSVVGQYNAFRTVPIVRRSYAETAVMIRDGETIIIAGMIENEKQEREDRVPFLGRIPILGALFRSVADTVRNNELIVFLTPRIITGEAPVLRMQDLKKKPKPLRAIGADEPVADKNFRPLR